MENKWCWCQSSQRSVEHQMVYWAKEETETLETWTQSLQALHRHLEQLEALEVLESTSTPISKAKSLRTPSTTKTWCKRCKTLKASRQCTKSHSRRNKSWTPTILTSSPQQTWTKLTTDQCSTTFRQTKRMNGFWCPTEIEFDEYKKMIKKD